MQQKLAFWNWAALANSIAKLYQESIVRLASHSKSTVSLHARKLTGMHSHNKRISGSDYQFAMLKVVTYCMSSRYSKKCGNTCFLVTCLRHNFGLRLLTVARSRWQHWTSTRYATQSALNNGKNKKAVKPIRQLHCTETERRSEIQGQLLMHDNFGAALWNQDFHATSSTATHLL